jgi:hypothetical protein
VRTREYPVSPPVGAQRRIARPGHAGGWNHRQGLTPARMSRIGLAPRSVSRLHRD